MAIMWEHISNDERNAIAVEAKKLFACSNLNPALQKWCLGLLDRLRPRHDEPSWLPVPPTENKIVTTWLASQIDHTLLKPEAVSASYEKLCAEAREFNFKAICVPPNRVVECVELLKGSPVLTITVTGFPLGYASPESMAQETRVAIEAGSGEVDMVIPYGALKDGKYAEVFASVSTVCKASTVESGVKILVKSILESAALSDAELACASAIALVAGADFIKTSTGFSATGGASLRAINIMRLIAGPNKGVKASGGIRDRATAIKMIEAGANRIGTSDSVAIVQDAPGLTQSKPSSTGDY